MDYNMGSMMGLHDAHRVYAAFMESAIDVASTGNRKPFPYFLRLPNP